MNAENVIGNRIRTRLSELHMTQKQLADKIGVSIVCVGNWVRCDVTPYGHNLVEISKALECSIEYLLGATEVVDYLSAAQNTVRDLANEYRNYGDMNAYYALDSAYWMLKDLRHEG